MPLTPHQQAVEQVSHAKRILLLTHQQPSHDNLASMVAFGLFLNKLNKTFDAVIPHFQEDKRPGFLAKNVPILSRLGATRSFHIAVNAAETPLSELLYDLKDGVLDITLIPKYGSWSPQDVSFKYGQDRYDLVVVFGCTDMAMIGQLNQEQTDFLYRTTTLNIDYRPSNEMWGQINLVQPTAVSTSEVIHHWIAEWNAQMIDQPLATALLSGMIANTRSFRSQNVTPNTLMTAAKLVELGAERERIVHELWRNKPVSALKLWGKALSRLSQDQAHGLVWTHVTEDDLIETKASPDDINTLVDELVSFSNDAKIIVILKQNGPKTEVRLFSQGTHSADTIARHFGGQGTKEKAEFAWQQMQAPPEIIEEIKKKLNG